MSNCSELDLLFGTITEFWFEFQIKDIQNEGHSLPHSANSFSLCTDVSNNEELLIGYATNFFLYDFSEKKKGKVFSAIDSHTIHSVKFSPFNAHVIAFCYKAPMTSLYTFTIRDWVKNEIMYTFTIHSLNSAELFFTQANKKLFIASIQELFEFDTIHRKIKEIPLTDDIRYFQLSPAATFLFFKKGNNESFLKNLSTEQDLLVTVLNGFKLLECIFCAHETCSVLRVKDDKENIVYGLSDLSTGGWLNVITSKPAHDDYSSYRYVSKNLYIISSRMKLEIFNLQTAECISYNIL